MRDWSPDHPRAKVMARKRAAIVAAAEQACGTAMQAVGWKALPARPGFRS